ncbi:hypothetical protein NCS52_00801900 [Fusarium sp. LHS14.1]|nr:hypothetical protein NCS52_00801900 [Fusarium sp. LHS14.1]
MHSGTFGPPLFIFLLLAITNTHLSPPPNLSTRRIQKTKDSNCTMYVVISGGDLVLVVGPEQRCIQVSVDLLRTSSPVFDDMISSGLIKTPDGLQGTMELPDDNALALLHALKILYGADPVMGQLTTKEIQEVAVLVDKYRMAPRFQFIGTFWMRSIPVDNGECWHLMTAAFWLRLRCSFFEMSKELARACGPSLFKYANETPDKVLGLRLGRPDNPIHHKIIEDGDVVLVVGPDKIRIQLSSSFLCFVSPLFKDMLSLPMTEGQRRLRERGDKPVRYLRLEGDNPEAVLHAFKSLYGSDPQMLNLNPGEILGVAVFVYRLQLAKRFQFAAMHWAMSPQANSYRPETHNDAWQLLLAS